MMNSKSSSLKGRRFSELMLRSSVTCENHVCVRACYYDGKPCEYVWVRHHKGGREVCSHPWVGNCEMFCPRYTKWREEMVDEDESVMAEVDAERTLLERSGC